MAETPDDPLEGLEERLANHTKAFDSLLALTPARDYYGSQIDDGLDPSEQWNRKKQTKEQKRAAKKAKLDPANQKSALDVMRERENKRKRDVGPDDEINTDEPASKKISRPEVDVDAPEADRRAKAEKRKEVRQRKKDQAAKHKAKVEAKKIAKQEAKSAKAQSEQQQQQQPVLPRSDEDDESEAEADVVGDFADLDGPGFSGLTNLKRGKEVTADNVSEASSVPTSPVIDSPAFDIGTNQSDTSSSSSILPPSVVEGEGERIPSQASTSKPQLNLQTAPSHQSNPSATTTLHKPADVPSGTSSPKIQLPNIDQAELQERLRKRIEELRARRKADDDDGKPAKSRQELLEQRRKKEEQRKAHKKELRRQAKEDEAQKREAQLRGSGSPRSADFFNTGSPRPQENNFSFSRLAFEDGTAANASLTALQDPRKRKGPQDPRTALEAAQKKQSRLAGLDEEKRANIADKDMWLNAKKRAHGERIRDDTSLLKKALKRKTKQKSKSEKEWQEREQAVVKGKEMKQKKRETNLQKRREEKGGKGKKKVGGAKPKGKKKRPGFEGSWKA